MTEKKENKIETKTLIQAIAEFQKSAPIILKSATNPFFKSKYADLPAVWHTIKDLMSANGLAVVNLNVIIEGQEYLETRIYHTGGEYLSSVSRLAPVKSDPQSVGSAITYMRRYALMSLLGLVADDDDDANQASGKTKVEKPVEKQPVKLEGDALLIADAMNSATSEKMLTQIGTVRKGDIDKMPDDVKHELKLVYSRKLADLKNLTMAG